MHVRIVFHPWNIWDGCSPQRHELFNKANVSWELWEMWIFAFTLLNFKLKVYSNRLERFSINLCLLELTLCTVNACFWQSCLTGFHLWDQVSWKMFLSNPFGEHNKPGRATQNIDVKTACHCTFIFAIHWQMWTFPLSWWQRDQFFIPFNNSLLCNDI